MGDVLGTPQVITIGAVCLALIALIWKMYQASQRTQERTADALDKLSNSIDSQKDTFSIMLAQMLSNKK